MTMVHCRGCGQQIHESAPVCPHCGAPQQAMPAAGAPGPLPPGVAGWSWGAFFLNWIWAAFNGVWIGLLALVPFVGFVMMIVLGIKGREWAWRAKRWASVEEFQRVQRKWSAWGVGLFVVPTLVGIVAAVALPAYQDYKGRSAQAAAEVEQAQRQRELDAAAEVERMAAEKAASAAAAQAEATAAAEAAAARAAEAAPVSAPSGPPAADRLAEAGSCARADACADVMLAGAMPRRADIMQAAATSLGNLPKPAQGDRKTARALNKRALDLLGQNNPAAAVPLLQQAVAADAADVEIKSNLGLALVKAGNPRDGIAALLAALELDPRRSAAWVPLADALEADGKADLAYRALLLAYEFSANKQRTLDYFRGRTTAADLTESSRAVFAKALGTVEAGY